ncbi:MAG: hypothetical protein IAF38_05920 [Bacteroidia bacterium]|nr:hypothetical protein [Bacteroidia bacterium]
MKALSISLFVLLVCFFSEGTAQVKTKVKPVKPGAAKPTIAMPSPVGKWFFKSPKGAIDSLIIRQDSTYKFSSYQPGLSTPESFSGKWKVKKNDVYLHIANTNDPYGQVRAIIATDGKIELFKVVRYFGNLFKAAEQMELRNK